MTRILVVDDAQEVRQFLQEYLDFCGFGGEDNGLEFAENGRKAQTIIQQTSLPFDLVITDTEMPELGGVKLTDWIKENFPAIPVILTSGRGEPPNHRADAFLGKPYPLDQLREVIKNLLKKPDE